MKNKLFKVLFGILILFSGINVYAAIEPIMGGNGINDLDGTASDTVKVSEVEVPVYSVDIFWDNLFFDWTFDTETGSFGWTPAALCEGGAGESDEFDQMFANGEIYTDPTCTTVAEEVIDEAAYFSIREREYVSFTIEDSSQNAQVVPSIRWEPSDSYSYVDAVFTAYGTKCVAVESQEVYDVAVDFGVYSDSTCSTETTGNGFENNKYYTLVEDKNMAVEQGELPDSARKSGAGSSVEVGDLVFVSSTYPENLYLLGFNLQNSSTPTTTPKTGDQIGTITVSIRAR